MKNKFIVLLLLVMCLSISGCSKQDNKLTETGISSESINENILVNSKDDPVNNSISSTEQEKNENARYSNILRGDDFNEKIKNVFYSKNNNVIVCADKLYLYDTQNGAIISESDNKYDIISINATNDGYASVATAKVANKDDNGFLTGDDESLSLLCVFYDEKLNVKSTINLNDIADEEQISFAAISKDRENIAFTSDKGLSVYNSLTEKSNQIISFSDTNKVKGLCFIEELFFIDASKLFFKGGSFSIPIKEGDKSFPTYGMVNVDGSDFTNKDIANYSMGENLSVYDACAIIPEFFMKASGRVLKVDTKTGEEVIYNLSSKGEGKDGVFGSDNGKYFATASLNNGLTVRVYETQNGKQVKEEYITDGNAAYFARVPSIKLLDDSKTCIVLLGERQNGIKTKAVTFCF